MNILEMNIYTYQNVVEFGPSEKTFNEEHLKIGSSVRTKRAIVNMPSEFLPPSLEDPIQSQNTISSTFMNHKNNNL